MLLGDSTSVSNEMFATTVLELGGRICSLYISSFGLLPPKVAAVTRIATKIQTLSNWVLLPPL